MNDQKPSAAQQSGASSRLVEIDSLRGIAALLVVLFHYTTRFDQVFGHVAPPIFFVPWGWLGVNIFFMISGFVIYMTLDRTRHPMDFIVSRFSRLYPAYWVAIALTFVLVAVLQLPAKTVDVRTAFANLLMFHEMFGFKSVDGVYWTLQVELLFYAIMLILLTAGLLKRPYWIFLAWLGLRLLYVGAERWVGVNLPGERFIILAQIPYFVIGAAIYLGVIGRPSESRKWWSLAAAALAVIAVTESWWLAVISILFAAVVYGAASKRVTLLRLGPLVWLGAISYPLYLLHENIGWGMLLNLEAVGWTPNWAILASICVVLLLAAMLHYTVEMPAMKRIRNYYRRHRQTREDDVGAVPTRRWIAGIAGTLAAIFAASTVTFHLDRAHAMPLPGENNITHIRNTDAAKVSCRMGGSNESPVVLLVLGQSNAGNHGELRVEEHSSSNNGVRIFFRGNCYFANDPLPGATGEGGSIWARLAKDLEHDMPSRHVIVAPLAVGSTSIATWTASGPLRNELDRLVAGLFAQNLRPTAVLWQQGETDRHLGTEVREYGRRFAELVDRLRRQGITAPVFVAQSTYCRGNGLGYLARAQERLPLMLLGVRKGPDMDSIQGNGRIDDCHFTHTGLAMAAQRWREVLTDM
jgi:peptidoglycan/LPS O-acetylase OafA/YrhL